MSFYQDAVSYNNEGVSFLVRGDYQSSITSFGRSVVALKTELQIRPTDEGVALMPSFTKPVLVSLEGEHNQRHQEQGIFFFAQAFQIPRRCDDDLTPLEIYVSCSVVIFNLALAHHLLAIKLRGSQHSALRVASSQQAAKLYTAVVSIFQGGCCRDHNNCTGWIVQLACTTNAMHLATLSGADESTVRQEFMNYFEIARDALRFLCVYCDDLFQDPRIEGLLFHVLLLEAPMVAAAA